MKINKNFLDLEQNYLFSTVAKKQREFQAAHSDADIIKLSIGDVTRPICPAVIDAMHKAVDKWLMKKPSADIRLSRVMILCARLFCKRIILTVVLIYSLMKFFFLMVPNLTVETLGTFLLQTILLQSAILFILFTLIQTL